MSIYLRSTSALKAYRHLRVTNPELLATAVRCNPSMEDAARRVSDFRSLPDDTLDLLRQLNIGWPEDRGVRPLRPISTLAASNALAAHNQWASSAHWNHNIPEPLLDLGHGVFLSSPAFLLLQMTSDLGLAGLSMLALEMCGTFQLDEQKLGSRITTTGVETTSCQRGLMPLTSVAELDEQLGELGSVRGVAMIREVLPHVVDGVSSALEAQALLLACLPRNRGGYGLPLPVACPEVELSSGDGLVTLSPSFFWPEARVAVFVEDEGSWQEDSKEQTTAKPAARRQPVHVSANGAVATAQLFARQIEDSLLFDEFMEGLALMLGHAESLREIHSGLSRQRLRGSLMSPAESLRRGVLLREGSRRTARTAAFSPWGVPPYEEPRVEVPLDAYSVDAYAAYDRWGWDSLV